MSDCPKSDDAVAWALHVLEPDEEHRVAAHLPTCPTCRAVVAETQETLAALGAGVEPEEPPAGLRSRILEEAARTPQVGNEPTEALLFAEPPVTSVPVSGPGPTPRRTAGSGPGRGSGRGRHRPRRGLRGRIVAVAAATLVALGAIAGLSVYSAQLAAQRDAETARAQALVSMVQQMATPGTAHAFLSPGQGRPAVAAVLATPAGQQMVLPVALPSNPSDHVYVLWGLPAEGTPAPLGTFDVRDGDSTVHSVGSSPDGAGFAQFAISLEPGRAAPAAPSDVVASGRAEI
ncbi:anti-sigma factor domain-containing protein [Pseudonocardia oroxyli]|uniref:Regulator of SigK n=1 Tax=Pseudonocardia oroxyli TaxID=366584 RepID=A0A1G7ZT60_PSEOR|nr:anti-sigma factor [Pseudonocardia oroxyli]SDH11861.1 Anti-sigma-K factor rskA [Pseudonocardia oroxyli]